MTLVHNLFSFFFFNDTATTEIYTLSLHDALPISKKLHAFEKRIIFVLSLLQNAHVELEPGDLTVQRSEEHTSELQSPCNLVCRLLLEKKKKIYRQYTQCIIRDTHIILVW